MLTTNQKGAIAELAIAHAAIKLGVGVYKPLTEGGRCDLIFDLGTRLVRVQCKWASRIGDVILVRCITSRRSAEGFVRRAYTAEDVDAIAAYCAGIERCYFLPIDRFEHRRTVSLRLSPTRNNQAAGIHDADSYEFEATLGSPMGP